jgi:nitrogen fixation NifU-like protein
LTDLLVGKTIEESHKVSESFMHLMQSKGTEKGDEQILEDAVALAGVSQYPARIKCALLGWMAFKDASVQAIAKNS